MHRRHVPKTHNPSPRLVRKDRKSTRLNSSHVRISYAVFCLKKKKKKNNKKIKKNQIKLNEKNKYNRTELSFQLQNSNIPEISNNIERQYYYEIRCTQHSMSH